MIDLDHEVETHLRDLEVPTGVGVEAVMKAGRRRRRLRAFGLTSGTVAIVGIAAFALGTVRPSPTIVDVATDEPAAQAGADSESEFFDALPDRIPNDATAPVPVVDGWTVQRSSLDLGDRYEDQSSPASYVLKTDTATVDLTVLPGNFGSPGGEAVDLLRPEQTVRAWIDNAGNAMTSITWNERPGNNSGTAVSVTGDDFEQVLAVAQTVVFVERALQGAESPMLVDLNDDRTVILDGQFDETQWQISDNDDEVVVEINGQSPRIGSSTGKEGPFEVHLTSVSSEGLQVHLLELPVGATAATILDGEFFPARTVDYGDNTYAVVVIPPGKDAVGIRVGFDGSALTVPLPLAPASGWSTHHLEFESN